MNLENVFAGVAGGILVLLGVIIFQFLNRQDSRSKYFNWEEILQEKALTLRQIGDMYLCSVTFGECATGELFGSLDRLQQELKPEVYRLIERAHREFGNKIAALYTYREYPEYVKRFQLEALVAYRKLKELKEEHKIDYVNPFQSEVEMYASISPVM